MTGSEWHDPRLKVIAADNEILIDQGFYRYQDSGMVPIADAVQRAVRDTRCYGPEDLDRLLDDLPSRAGRPWAWIEVTAEKSLQAARRVRGEEGGGTVGVLNFASANKPGGGYLTGARAQEEDLCRCSSLYRCLLQASSYYATHRARHDPFYSHRVICSPDVPVFRDEQYRLTPAPFPVTFLTSPAPNAGEISRDAPQRLPRVSAVLTARVAMILAVASHHQVDDLVLGAWGCGVFRNEPGDVAAAFRTHLTTDGRFARQFRRIVFAVYDPRPAHPNLTAFQAAFAEA
jgi:uncharacterized protein (TIGR02452 family)